jgi:hypothetical protein
MPSRTVLNDLHLVFTSCMDPPRLLAHWQARSELDRLSPGARLAYSQPRLSSCPI